MKSCSFQARVWKYKGSAGWHFVTLPKSLSKKIRKKQGLFEEGWGRLSVVAKIKSTTWQTAIWYDTKTQSYLLPVKAEVRKNQKIEIEDLLQIDLRFLSHDIKKTTWLKLNLSKKETR